MQYFEERERKILAENYDAFYNAPAEICRGITVNALRCTPESFFDKSPFAISPSPFCKAAFKVDDADARLGISPYHHAGVYYVQEPSAGAAADLLNVKPNDTVLDMCAAPGGKTSRLAALMQGQGLLIANEYVAARATLLKNNLERMGVTNAVVLNEDTSRIAKVLPQFFNKILLDAPCSGEGMFRKEPQAVTQHSEALVKQCAALGSQLLDNAAACLADGGDLLYSTCTFAPDEDEAQIGAFLARHSDFELVKIDVPYGSQGEKARAGEWSYNAEYTRRIYPCHGGEGHFMALLHKKGEYICQNAQLKPLRIKQNSAMQACADFLKAYFPSLAAHILQNVGQNVYILPQTLPPLEKLHVICAGVLAGECVKNRFEPSHALFMTYGAQCRNKENIDISDDRAMKWLHGEEIDEKTAQNGYCAVLIDGFPAGFGKQSGGKIKNRYPKGLRNLK